MNDLDFRFVVEQVRERTEIVQVIGQRLELDRHHKARCPFHEEKTPSFSVNAEGQYFHCFGCGIGGDVFRFVELYENKPFMQVLSELAEQAGITLQPLTVEARTRILEHRRIEEVLTATAKFYHESLTPEVRGYLMNQRNFTIDIISQFRLGYANGKLKTHLIDECQFPIELCLKSGVLKQANESCIKDFFYDRVIFPHFSKGRVVHMTGRIFGDGAPKYLHLAGEIHHLYNDDVLLNKTIFIAEGIPDCITAVQQGYPTVGVLGASGFKSEYVPKLSHCETIFLIFHPDDAGLKGLLKAGELVGERARVITLPNGIDLNDYFKTYTKEDFDRLVVSSQDLIKYELSLITEDVDKIELAQRLKRIIGKLAKMSQAEAEAYLSYVIKPRFNLKEKDIDGYRNMLKACKKDEAPSILAANAKDDHVYTASFDGLVDLVEHKGDPAFLIRQGDSLSILTQFESAGVIYIPPPLKQIPWLLPRGEEVIRFYDLQKVLSERECGAALYDDLLRYHEDISELPYKEHYDLLVSWDFHTYFPEKIHYSPEICLCSVPERGKTRTGKRMIYMGYRGIHVESLRDAYLVRVANDLHASLFFDVKELWRKAEKNGTEDILLHRFEKGARVPRVLYPERGAHQDIVYYTIFGPTIIK